MHKDKIFGLGIDIGATKISGAIIDQTGRMYEQLWESTKKDSLDNLLKQIHKITYDLMQKFDGEDWYDTIPIGIGLAGTINLQDQKITFAPNISILKELKLEKLSSIFKGHPVFYDNDAKCALVAELLIGEAAFEQNVILLTLGTGVGGAIAINGQLYRGSYGGAGELGQIMADWEMYSRSRGARGTAEQLLGGKYLELLYKKSAKELFDLIRQNQNHPFLDRWISALLATLITLENIFKPDLFLLSGSISESSDVFLSTIASQLNTPIKIAKFSKNAGTIGAGMLALSGTVQQNNSQ